MAEPLDKKRKYDPPAIQSDDLNFARASHCAQCDEGATGVAFTEIHPSGCDFDQSPQSNS